MGCYIGRDACQLKQNRAHFVQKQPSLGSCDYGIAVSSCGRLRLIFDDQSAPLKYLLCVLVMYWKWFFNQAFVNLVTNLPFQFTAMSELKSEQNSSIGVSWFRLEPSWMYDPYNLCFMQRRFTKTTVKIWNFMWQFKSRRTQFYSCY